MDSVPKEQSRTWKHRLWHCERCRIYWSYDSTRDEVDNWHGFITHTNLSGQRCQPYPIKNFITGNTVHTDIRILLRESEESS